MGGKKTVITNLSLLSILRWMLRCWSVLSLLTLISGSCWESPWEECWRPAPLLKNPSVRSMSHHLVGGIIHSNMMSKLLSFMHFFWLNEFLKKYDKKSILLLGQYVHFLLLLGHKAGYTRLTYLPSRMYISELVVYQTYFIGL